VAARAKKTKGKRVKAKARKVAIYDLGDSNWWRLAKVYRRLLPQLRKHTASDLTEKLKSGKLRSVRRFNSGQCKPVRAKFWQSLPWPAKLYFDNRLGAYDPEFYVWRPWEVWPVLQVTDANGTEASKPERKRAKGGGAKSMYTDEETERGKEAYRKMLLDDPSWRSASQEAVAMHVRAKAKLLGCPRTVHRNIIKPVNAELE
jgi:hypothetical protein